MANPPDAKRKKGGAPISKQDMALMGHMDADETWALLDEGLRDYEEAEAKKPKPRTTKVPSWMADIDSDDDGVGWGKSKSKSKSKTPPGSPAPIEPAPIRAAAALGAAEDSLSKAWMEVARQEADKKKQKEMEEAAKLAAEEKAAKLKKAEEEMERAVEEAKRVEEANAKKRLEKMKKAREARDAELQKKREERQKAAEEELKRRKKLEVEDRKRKRVEDKEKWKEEEILQGFHGAEEAAKLAAEKRSREEQEKKDIEEAKALRKEYERMKHFSPNLAKKFEAENKERFEKANRVLAEKDEKIKRMREKQQMRRLKDEITKGSTEDRVKEQRRKQVAIVAEQRRLAEEAAKQAAAQFKEESAPPPADTTASSAVPWSKEPPPGARQLVDDKPKLRATFQGFPTLSECTDTQADHAGQLCVIEKEATTDGTKAVVQLRFQDGHVSWWPKLCLQGEAWWEMPEGFSCDLCGKVCVTFASRRARVCGDLSKVKEAYDKHCRTGVLPPWNLRNVPNPRRAQCPGQECDIVEEDLLNKKVLLQFDATFSSWFPLACLQGGNTRMDSFAKKSTKKPTDPRGFGDGVPESLPPIDTSLAA